MNFARNAILTAIIFQMVSSTFPVQSYYTYAAEPPAKVNQKVEDMDLPTINKVIDQTMAQHNDLVSGGCIDKNGKVTPRTLTNQQAIHAEKGTAITCMIAVKNYLTAEKIADEAVEEKLERSQNCESCGTDADKVLRGTNKFEKGIKAELDSEIECSEAEKAAIKKETCSLTCGAQNLCIATSNLVEKINPLRLLGRDTSTPQIKRTDCPVFEGNFGNCLFDIAKTFTLSTVDMCVGGFNMALGALNAGYKWARDGIFGNHEKAEAAATTKALAISGMKDAEQKKAAQDHGKSWMERLTNGIGNFIVTQFIDPEEYAAEFQCQHCHNKLQNICKVIGLIGKDAVKLMLLDYIMGRPIKWAGKQAGKGFKNLMFRNASTKAFYEGTAVAWAKLGRATAERWKKFRSGSKIVGFDKNSFAKAGTGPSEIILGSRKGTDRLINDIAERDQLLAKVGSKGGETTLAKQSLEESLKNSKQVLVGMEVPGQDEAVAKAKKSILKFSNGQKEIGEIHLENIEEAKPAKIGRTVPPEEVPASSLGVKKTGRPGKLSNTVTEPKKFLEVEAENGQKKVISVNPKKDIASVLTYEEKDGTLSTIVRNKDGSATIHTSKGVIEVPKGNAKVLNEVTGKTVEGRPVEQLRKEAIEKNLDESEIKHTEENGKIKIDDKDCGPTFIDPVTGLISKVAL